ncbi:MAG: hypothetical protein WBA41_22825 [Rivularia sp. (in: cyanobacteria)]
MGFFCQFFEKCLSSVAEKRFLFTRPYAKRGLQDSDNTTLYFSKISVLIIAVYNAVPKRDSSRHSKIDINPQFAQHVQTSRTASGSINPQAHGGTAQPSSKDSRHSFPFGEKMNPTVSTQKKENLHISQLTARSPLDCVEVA